ncbi:hypothetical protein J3D54_000418 [Pseudomonas sp. GGS8]|uniref:hypothetical protein n=1 Tax=Pseudomonas sp. GGS8 TaxID=2817892 RepID=UPI00209FAD9C|nr:hypothetical protein [Pseudomonas sp. GGS8]MCP1441286.1 hypothetical protein [Pseudomonas sp. GGS8]
MSDEKDISATSPANSNSEEPLQINAVSERSGDDGTVKLALDRLEVQRENETEVSGTSSQIVFNVPQRNGEHQVWIKYITGPDVRTIVDGVFYKGNVFNYLSVHDLPVGEGYYQTQWKYGSQWSELGYKRLSVRSAPVIDGADGMLINVVISGAAGAGGQVTVVRSGDPTTIMSETKTVGDNNRWSLMLKTDVRWGVHDVVISQYFNERFPIVYTGPKRIVCLKAPAIDSPDSGAVILHGTPILLKGRGAPNEIIELKNFDRSITHAVTTVSSDGSYVATLNQANYPNGGEVEIIAKHRRAGDISWSGYRTLYLLAIPTITGPEASSLQTSPFELSGSGTKGAIVRVYQDVTDKIVGESGKLTGTDWSCSVTVPAGVVSLVTTQIMDGKETTRSEARAFKVRPAMLGNITCTFPSENTVKFSGTGVEGATIVFTWVSGEVTAPASVVVKDGTWETTATDWPFAKYSVVVIQKVSDNDGGWIESYGLYFDVQVPLPNPSEVGYTKVYRPTIYGKGTDGATVQLLNPGGGSSAAPDAPVSDGVWSSQVEENWGEGPIFKKEIHIRQTKDGLYSPVWTVVEVTIPPLAPVIEEIEQGVLSPKFTGTCWSQGATVVLRFSDESATEYPATVTGSIWSFQRETPFAEDVLLRVTVTQHVAQQTSPSAWQDFIVSLPIPRPEITDPQSGSEVGSDLTVYGEKGMEGCRMQLRDAQLGGDLGSPKTLTRDGGWFIELRDLDFRLYNIVAVQKRNQRESAPSERIDVTVGLLPPEITVPSQNGQLPRTAMLEGKGMRGGRVTIWLQGVAEPLASDVPVDNDSNWKVWITLLVGFKNIQAEQTFGDRTSIKSEMLSFSVVPEEPFIETPVMGAHISRRTVVSGFGVSGDTVTVALSQATRTVLSTSVVQQDRTWSVTLEFDQPDGNYALVAVASCDGFDSADSPARPVVLGTYLPIFKSPAAGQWTSDPVGFNGQGRAGVGQVLSWFNPDQIWAPDLPVTFAWQGSATQPLPHGGNWCRFKQTITDDADGATVSDYVESPRFEVLPPSSES